jgi:hypothetical protein
MNLKDPFTRIGITIAIGLLSFIYNQAFEEQYKSLQIYWIIGGIIRLLFWVVAIYPNYRWRSLNLFRRAIVVAISIDFCLVFLPVDLLLSPLVDRIRNSINWIVLAAILLDDRGDGDGGKGKKVEDTGEEVDKHRLAISYAILTQQKT